MAEKKDQQIIEQISKELLQLLGEENFQLQVEKGEESEWWIKIEVENPAPLIGYRGKALEALQLILKMIIGQQLEQWQPIVVDINQYREKQKSRIIELAYQAAAEARETNRETYLPPMAPYERRLVHLALKKEKDLETVSQGEEDQRQVVVRLKKKAS